MYGRLAFKFIRRSKRQTIYMCAALMIAGSLIMMSGNLMYAYGRMNLANVEQRYGSWHLKLWADTMGDEKQFFQEYGDVIEAVGREEYLYSTTSGDIYRVKDTRPIEADRAVKTIDSGKGMEVIDSDRYVDLYDYDMDILACDSEWFELSKVDVIKGRLPVNEHELLLNYEYNTGEASVLSDYQVGDEITFSVGRRMEGNQVVYGDCGYGVITETEDVTYTIVGFCRQANPPEFVPQSYTKRETLGSADRYLLRLTEQGISRADDVLAGCGIMDSRYVFDTEMIGWMLEDEFPASRNGSPISAARKHGYIGAKEQTRVWFYVVACLIFLAGFFMVMNIYHLVLSKRAKEYATLKAMGMGEGGILLISFVEGLFLWVTASLLSVLLTFGLNAGMQKLIRAVGLSSLKELRLTLSLDMIEIGCIASFVMMFLAVILNDLGRRKLSVRQLITGHIEYKGRRKKSSLRLPIELRLSGRYIGSNRLKFFLLTLSLAVSILLVYGFYCAEKESRVSELIDGQYYSADFYAWGNDVWNIPELIEEIPFAEYISCSYIGDLRIPNDELPFSEETKENPGLNEEWESGKTLITVGFADREEYERSIRPRLTEDMTYEKWAASGTGLLDDWYLGGDGEFHQAFGEEENIVLSYSDCEEDIWLSPYKAGSMFCKKWLAVDERGVGNYTPDDLYICILYPEERLHDFFERSAYQFVYITAVPDHEFDLLEWLTSQTGVYNYTIQDNITEQIYRKNLRFILLASVSFVCVLLLLVCMVNLWNVTESNIYERMDELRVLGELGMSKVQKFFVCMPDLFLAVLLALILANLAAKQFILHGIKKNYGIPLWLNAVVLLGYLLVILIISIPMIRKEKEVRAL